MLKSEIMPSLNQFSVRCSRVVDQMRYMCKCFRVYACMRGRVIKDTCRLRQAFLTTIPGVGPAAAVATA